jgi:nucleoside-diphosphate-sugar epimerase
VAERVLVTGATGFVGSHVARAFAGAGYKVRCTARATSDTRSLEGLAAELVTLDLGQPETLVRAVGDVQIVVHAAGITRARRDDDYHAVNAEGTRRLAAAAEAAGVRRFVLISSLAARGPDGSTGGGQDRPASAYGRSKLEAERCLRDFGGRMEVVALRPSAVYGPRDADFLPLIKMARAGWVAIPATCVPLQPVYAGDVSRAALAAAREPVGFGPFPVAEAARYGWPDVMGALEKALGRRVRAVRLPSAMLVLAGSLAEKVARVCGAVPTFDARRARDLAVHAWTCDVSGTERALGWRAEILLHEGLERTVRWYRGAGWLGIKTP